LSIQTIITKAQQLLLIVIVFCASVAACSQTISGERIIAADFTKLKGPYAKVIQYSVGAGRGGEGLRANWQQQLALVEKDIRFHGLLHDDTLNVRKKTEHLVNSKSYWTFTDIFEEAGPPAKSFYGGFGLLILQDIKKPTYYAFQFMNELGPTDLINRDGNLWVCKDAKGNVQALFCNYKLLSPDSLYNQQFYNKIIPPDNAVSATLSFSNIPDGRYKMQVYQTGHEKNDAFMAYKKMDAPFNINRQQEAAVKKVAAGQPSTKNHYKGTLCAAVCPERERCVFCQVA
jgi:hypothetical protein